MSGLPPSSKSSAVTWEGDIAPPTTTYAASIRNSPLHSSLRTPASNLKTRSSVVDRKDIRKGIRYFYSHGGVTMPGPRVPTVGAGGVQNSEFQKVLVQLQDWVINVGWRMGGYPRNLGLSFRVGQLQTNVTGGPGAGAMQQRPVFPAVQVVPRYTAAIRRYPTKSSKS